VAIFASCMVCGLGAHEAQLLIDEIPICLK
jgi:hypothetical protein